MWYSKPGQQWVLVDANSFVSLFVGMRHTNARVQTLQIIPNFRHFEHCSCGVILRERKDTPEGLVTWRHSRAELCAVTITAGSPARPCCHPPCPAPADIWAASFCTSHSKRNNQNHWFCLKYHLSVLPLQLPACIISFFAHFCFRCLQVEGIGQK